MPNALAVQSNEQKKLVGTQMADYPIFTSSKQVGAIIKKNFGERKLNPNLLPRVKVASGDVVGFLMPSLSDEPHLVSEFLALCVLQIDGRRYWSKSFDEGGRTPPDCMSDDLITGRGDPGGKCEECPYSQWGSAGENSRGQACQDRKILFLALPGDTIPSVFNVPPTSIGNVQSFFLQLGGKQLEYDQVILKFKAEKATNAAGVGYTQIRVSSPAFIDDELLGKWKSYCDDLIPFLKQRRISDDFSRPSGDIQQVSPEVAATKPEGAEESKAAFDKAAVAGGGPDPQVAAAEALEELERLTS